MSRAAARALSVAVVLAACNNRSMTDDVSMSVSAWPLSLSPTQVATVHFAARNLTDRTITIGFGNACHFTYEVRNSSGSVIDATAPTSCSGPAHTVEIQPFGVLIDSVPWPSTFSRPAPGRYALRGFLGDDRGRAAGPLTIVLE